MWCGIFALCVEVKFATTVRSPQLLVPVLDVPLCAWTCTRIALANVSYGVRTDFSPVRCGYRWFWRSIARELFRWLN